MSDRKSRVDPNFTPGKVKPPSGNEGRLHPGMKHGGSYGRPAPLDDSPETARRQRHYEGRHERDG